VPPRSARAVQPSATHRVAPSRSTRAGPLTAGRRLAGDSASSVGWLAAQEHYGENIGDTPTHVMFVELKEPVTTTRDTEASFAALRTLRVPSTFVS